MEPTREQIADYQGDKILEHFNRINSLYTERFKARLKQFKDSMPIIEHMLVLGELIIGHVPMKENGDTYQFECKCEGFTGVNCMKVNRYVSTNEALRGGSILVPPGARSSLLVLRVENGKIVDKKNLKAFLGE